jgi:hypothetical protein
VGFMLTINDFYNIKPDAKNIYIIGTSPSIDLFDFGQIDYENSIIITANSSLCLCPKSDIQICMDIPPILAYAEQGSSKTIWIGRGKNKHNLHKSKPLQCLFYEDLLDGQNMGSGSTAFQMAYALQKSREIDNIFVVGIDLMSIKLLKNNKEYFYANKIKPYLLNYQRNKGLPTGWDTLGFAPSIQGVEYYRNQLLAIGRIVHSGADFAKKIQSRSLTDYNKINIYDLNKFGFPKYVKPLNCIQFNGFGQKIINKLKERDPENIHYKECINIINEAIHE